jgi:formylglycine-generating enzyme required for sulfatase activity/tRNA A-37 threonylcarbamoyl transferase component Bud32
MAAERHLRVQQLVDAYLREGADLPTYLLKVEADLRDEVAAQCREATFAAQFFQELPPLRLLQAPPEVIGDCRLGEALGEGAMGQVFRARQAGLDRDVAVKLIRPEHADRADFLSRFRDEAKLLAALDHPGIVRVHHCGEDQGWLYYVMDLVPGRSLAAAMPELLREEGTKHAPRRFDRVARIVAEVLEALAYAHGQGVVHRDLKPGNLMLDDAGRPRLVDFGLAKSATAPQRTLPGSVLGTPAYLSPELAGRRSGSRTAPDLWAVGVILFQLLTGRLPYDGRDTDELLRLLLRPVRLDVRTLVPDVPAPLATIVATALAPELDERYPSAAAFAADLRRFLAGEPVEAARRTALGTLRRVLWRHRRAVVAAALVLGGGAATFAWASHRATVREQQAQLQRLEGIDAERAEPAVLASALARLDELLGDALDDSLRQRGERLATTFRRHAAVRHAEGKAQVVAGAGTPVGTPLAQHRAPVPAVLAAGLRQVVEASLVDPSLPPGTRRAGQRRPAVRDRGPIGSRDRRGAHRCARSGHRPTGADGRDDDGAVHGAGVGGSLPDRGRQRRRVRRMHAHGLGSGTYAVAPALTATAAAIDGMLLVPAGAATIGQTEEGASIYATTTVQHAAFYIDRCEVTCGAYHAYCVATGAPFPEGWGAAGASYDPAWANLPVYGVRWQQARAFAEHHGKRLPTFAEWQIAARGRDGHPFPWGIDEGPIANLDALPMLDRRDLPWALGVRAVGTTMQDASWCGAMDMLGNVSEWTDTVFVGHLDGVPFPVLPWHVCAGSNWETPRKPVQLTLAGVGLGPTEFSDCGFRCAKSAAH